MDIQPPRSRWPVAEEAGIHIPVQRVAQLSVARPLVLHPVSCGVNVEYCRHRTRHRVTNDGGLGLGGQHYLCGRVAADAVGDDKPVSAWLADEWVCYSAVAHLAFYPAVGAASCRTNAYLYRGAGAGLKGVEHKAVLSQYQHIVGHSVRGAATVDHICHKSHGIASRGGVEVLRIGLRRGGTVTEIPQKRLTATGVVEVHRLRGTTCRWRSELGHGEAVGKVQPEYGVVAVVAVVVLAVCPCCHWKCISTAAACTDRLIDRAEAVEAAGAAIHVVLAAAIAVARHVQFTEEGGVGQQIGIHIDRHQVEILPVGLALVGVWSDGHSRGASRIPVVLHSV